MVTNAMTEGNRSGTPEESEQEDETQYVDTQQTAFNLTLSGPEWREMHVFLEITYKSQSEAANSPMKHLEILTAMFGAFPADELVMFDNKGRKN